MYYGLLCTDALKYGRRIVWAQRHLRVFTKVSQRQCTALFAGCDRGTSMQHPGMKNNQVSWVNGKGNNVVRITISFYVR